MSLSWKDVANAAPDALKLLGSGLALTGVGAPFGALIAGPLSSAVGSVLGTTPATPENVAASLTDPAMQEKWLEVQSNNAVHLQELHIQAASADAQNQAAAIAAVNATMQSEAKSDHWPTYSWRPFIGFTFGAYITSLWVLPLFGKTPVILSTDITLAIGGILGVASYFRGKAQADPNIPTDNRG